MIGQLKRHKLIVAAAVIVILAIAWFVISGDGATKGTSLLQTSSMPASLTGNATVGGVDSELQVTLQKLRAIQLNSQILSDPTFLSLQDFGQQIVPEPFGRSNPFAPIQAPSSH